MRRIVIPCGLDVMSEGGPQHLSFAPCVAHLVEADPSFVRWPKVEMGVAIIDKLSGAKGHVFLADDEWTALVQTLKDVQWLPVVAFPAARAGWYRAIVDAEEWTEVEGELRKKS